jgi:hypothetical protein
MLKPKSSLAILGAPDSSAISEKERGGNLDKMRRIYNTYIFIYHLYMIIEYFSDERYIYSVGLMFVYINIYNPKRVKLPIDDLKFNLEYNS